MNHHRQQGVLGSVVGVTLEKKEIVSVGQQALVCIETTCQHLDNEPHVHFLATESAYDDIRKALITFFELEA